jgi:lamin B
LADLEKQLVKLKKQLEDETLARVDLENKNQTLREDLQFKSSLYEKETHQLRSSKRTEIEQVDVRLRDEYDSRLVAELQRIREEAEFKIQEMKDEVERRFTNKLAEAESQLKRQATTAGTLRDEASTYRARSEELISEVRSLQIKITSHETKHRELEDRLSANNGKHARDIADREAEIQRLNKELNELLLEYQELHDIKIALDMEISAYRKLLESEEQRLNISHQHSQLSSSFLGADQSAAANGSSASRGSKKRRLTAALDFDESALSAGAAVSTSSAHYTQSHTSSSGIEIAEHDFEGRQIRLLNTNDKDVAIGGWVLRRNADAQQVEHKFSAKVVLKPGQQITVWSANASGVTHDPANGDFVMTEKRWLAGESMITSLLDKETTVS